MMSASSDEAQPVLQPPMAPSGVSTRLRQAAWHAAGLAAMLLGLLCVTFAVARFLPTDPVVALVGDRASAETYQKARKELHLDRPLAEQFGLYVADMLNGRFGTSSATGRDIGADILAFFPATLELASFAIVLGAGAGVPLGLLCARHAGRWQDHLGRVFSLVGHSIPIFWLGLVGLLVFYAGLGWVGGPGRLDIAFAYSVPTVTGMVLVDTLLAGNFAAFGNALSHLVLPGGIRGLAALGYITRMTRAFAIAEVRKDYVLTARLKGLSEWQIMVRHILPVVAGPVVAVVAWMYALLLEGAVLTETVFAWPGLGAYLTQSLLSADIRAVLASTLVIGAAFCLLNLFAEFAQRGLDPRTRAAS